MTVSNPVKLPSAGTLTSTEDQLIDERTVRTIQQQYQAGHQEEFLNLRAQVEALLTELKGLTSSNSGNDSELAL
jgi:antibiotic biosynthesis monooxygenase (ABM) superfamily enzyme